MVRWLLAGLTAITLQAAPSTQLSPPARTVCHRVEAGPVIDGRGEDAAWKGAEWMDRFVDIAGPGEAGLGTRVKMVWDEKYLYILAEMEDPHIWATMTERNGPLFKEAAFEVFIDPDGDRKNYYEFEVNPLGTVLELTMDKPYLDGGKSTYVGVEGIKMAVVVDGTVNNPADTDKRWTVEMAIPFSGLGKIVEGGGAPAAGQTWRMNFMRVHVPHRVEGGKYVRDKPSDHWVWSRQGVVNMHVPERWGFVEFAK